MQTRLAAAHAGARAVILHEQIRRRQGRRFIFNSFPPLTHTTRRHTPAERRRDDRGRYDDRRDDRGRYDDRRDDRGRYDDRRDDRYDDRRG